MYLYKLEYTSYRSLFRSALLELPLEEPKVSVGVCKAMMFATVSEIYLSYRSLSVRNFSGRHSLALLVDCLLWKYAIQYCPAAAAASPAATNAWAATWKGPSNPPIHIVHYILVCITAADESKKAAVEPPIYLTSLRDLKTWNREGLAFIIIMFFHDQQTF